MKNYFELFNLTPKFTIDLSEIEKKYHQFQNQFHPDKADFDSIEHSILINEAYKILSDDFLRASHLLQLKNIDIENDENHIKPDITTLQEILDLSLSDETTSWHQSQEKWVRVAKNAAGEPLQDLQSVYIKRYKKAH